MNEIKAYLLPSQNYQMINNNDLLELDKTVSSILEKDIALVPDEFYEVPDSNGISGTDYLFCNGQSDLNIFLLNIIERQKHSTKKYREICQEEDTAYTLISESDAPEDKQHLCVKSTEDLYKNDMVTVNDLLRIKRYYLNSVVDYDSYVKRCSVCYPALIFHEDAFRSIKKLGKFSSISKELTRHLEALNDYGYFIYNRYNNEETALKYLESKCKITCSGKGSNEHISFKKQMVFQGNTYTITCNSHTKFFNGNNDQRIYFSWGRDDICNHKIIIISIGPHWGKIAKGQ